MATTRKLQVKLSSTLELLSQEAPGQPFVSKVSDSFSNLGDAQANAPVNDRYQDTVPVPNGAPVAIDLSAFTVIDYVWVTSDQDITVQWGSGDVTPVHSLYAKDGDVLNKTLHLACPTANTTANVTLFVAGH